MAAQMTRPGARSIVGGNTGRPTRCYQAYNKDPFLVRGGAFLLFLRFMRARGGAERRGESWPSCGSASRRFLFCVNWPRRLRHGSASPGRDRNSTGMARNTARVTRRTRFETGKGNGMRFW